MMTVHFLWNIVLEELKLENEIYSYNSRVEKKVSWPLSFFLFMVNWIWLLLHQKEKKVVHQNRLQEIEVIEIFDYRKNNDCY